MAISQKPKPKATAKDPNVDVDELINKGGSVASSTPTPKSKKNPAVVNLHLPDSLIERVNNAVKSRTLKTPRHTWLLEAVLEKLEKEGF